MIKEQLDKYEVLCLLGEGATARVFLARDQHLDRFVAVKKGKEKFLPAEMCLLKELDHPGLPKIYDFFVQGENSYLVMEYVEGTSLRKYLKRHGRVYQAQAVLWILQLCEILSYLHDQRPSVVYRDLKPENIMIRPDGRLKLIDLGAAARAAFGRAETGLCMGTPGYSPAEQWQTDRVAKTLDIFSMGAVLHEMLTGADPRQAPAERRPIREYDKSLSIGLEKFVKACVQTKAKDRYQSMEEAMQALKKCASIDRKTRIFNGLKQFLVWGTGGGSAALTLWMLHQGVPAQDFTVSFFKEPLLLLLLSLLLKRCFAGRQPACIRHTEKAICLTEKQFPGLYGLMLTAAGISLGFLLSGMPPMDSRAVEEKKLWVEMRDEQNRKLLLKENAVYLPKHTLRLEIPADRLPEERIALQLVAVGDSGSTYGSRIFHIETQSEKP